MRPSPVSKCGAPNNRRSHRLVGECKYVRVTTEEHGQIALFFSQIKERLWIKPQILCVLSIGGAFIARLADNTGLSNVLPEISMESVETLLSNMASSMLIMATFTVGSMVAAAKDIL